MLLSKRNAKQETERMKHGHVTGKKQERKGSTEWYKQIEEEHIRQIEAAWQVQQPSPERSVPCLSASAASSSPSP